MNKFSFKTINGETITFQDNFNFTIRENLYTIDYMIELLFLDLNNISTETPEFTLMVDSNILMDLNNSLNYEKYTDINKTIFTIRVNK